MKRVRLMLFLAVVLTFNTSFAIEYIESSKNEEEIVKGVSYINEKSITNLGFLNTDVLIIDGNNENISFKTLRNNEDFRKLTRVSELAGQNPDVVGAVNASFFGFSKGYGDSIGLELADKKFSYAQTGYNLSQNKFCNFITTENEKLFKYLSVDFEIANANNESFKFQGYNVGVVDKSVLIFNNRAYKCTDDVLKLGDVTLVLVENNIVKGVVTENVELTDNNYVISIPTTMFDQYNIYLPVESELKINSNINFNMDEVKTAIAGGGVFLRDSAYVNEGLAVAPNGKHPRTAIGINKNTNQIILVTVDGRGKSIGANAQQMADIMLRYGATDAMRFDGGGSTSMVKKGRFDKKPVLVNKPSDGRERAVINALGVISKKAENGNYTFKLFTDRKEVFAGNKLTVIPSLLDEFGNRITLDESSVTYNVSGDYTREGNNFFIKSAGNIDISASYNGMTDTTQVVVNDALSNLVVSPKVIYDNKATIRVSGISKTGEKVSLVKEKVLFKKIGNIADVVNFEYTPNGNNGIIEVSYNGVKQNIFVMNTVNFSGLDNVYKNVKKVKFTQGIDQFENLPVDSMLLTEKVDANTPKLCVFGSTEKSKLLENKIVLAKLFDKVKLYTSINFIGKSDCEDFAGLPVNLVKTEYGVLDNGLARIISLKSKNWSFLKEDYTQYEKLKTAIRTAPTDVVVINSDVDVHRRLDFKYKNEHTLFHEMIARVAKEAGKTIFYVNNDAWSTRVYITDNIRYVYLCGLNIKNKAKSIDDMYRILTFYKVNGATKYSLESVF